MGLGGVGVAEKGRREPLSFLNWTVRERAVITCIPQVAHFRRVGKAQLGTLLQWVHLRFLDASEKRKLIHPNLRFSDASKMRELIGTGR